MSDQPTSEPDRSRAARLSEELEAFTEAELAELDALAEEMRALRSTVTEPTFDRGAIWSRIERRLATMPPPDDAPATD